jgi:hypothetical protein
MARMPGAVWRGPTINEGDGDGVCEPGDRLQSHDIVVVHIAEGTFEGTIAWQKNPRAKVSSHFIVARDGRIAQMVDTDIRSWTQRKGNPRCVSIENEGKLPTKLSPSQITANAKILAWCHQTHGIPLQLTDKPSQRGLGHHSMGAEHGEDWGHSACPGPDIKAQKPAILQQAIDLVNGEDVEAKQLLTVLRDQLPGTYLDGAARHGLLHTAYAGTAADGARDRALLAAVEALATAKDIDSAPIVAAVNAVRSDAAAEVMALFAELEAASRREAELHQLLAEAQLVTVHPPAG